jgi:hypothetical protein
LNSKIEDIRRQIERCFGGVKMMFDCLLRPWRHDRNWLTPVARFCCAIYNNKLRYERMREEYSTEWNYEIPQIVNPKLIGKKVFFYYFFWFCPVIHLIWSFRLRMSFNKISNIYYISNYKQYFKWTNEVMKFLKEKTCRDCWGRMQSHRRRKPKCWRIFFRGVEFQSAIVFEAKEASWKSSSEKKKNSENQSEVKVTRNEESKLKVLIDLNIQINIFQFSFSFGRC